jgi:hypothetical protein
MAKKVGVHRAVTNDCVTCHVEHAGVDGELRPFDPGKFDHARQTGFALDGKHAAGAANCALCHKTRSFVTASAACASCHTDVHKGALGKTCERCHSTKASFKAVSTTFDHRTTAFPLAGAHRSVACARCHVTSTFKGVKFASCTNCHKTPHPPAVSNACTTCHTNDTWKTRRFDHDRTAFPLVARHALVECAACHREPAAKVKPASSTCATCHADPHRGTFRQDCKVCHNEKGFSGAPFDHAAGTGFALTEGHAGRECRSCHKTITAAGVPLAKKMLDYRGLGTSTCATCHVDPHRGQLGATCATCHTTRDFRVSTFAHPRFPELFGGQHAALRCEACHKPPAPSPSMAASARAGAPPARTGTPPARGAGPPDRSPAPQVLLSAAKFAGTPTACASCHADVHLGQVRGTCESCHSVGGAKFAVVGFSHDRARFRLTGAHASVACANCHRRETGAFPAGSGTATRLTGVRTECRSCHADVHLGQVAASCETCHATDTFRVSRYTHRGGPRDFFVGRHVRAACSACHKPATGQFPAGKGTAVRFAIPATCVSCHTDVHNGTPGQDCARCHRPEPLQSAHAALRRLPGSTVRPSHPRIGS